LPAVLVAYVSSEEKRSAPFNTTIGKWQYASFAFNLDNGETDDLTPTKIRVYAISFRQGSTVCFDNLMLTKEAVPSYTYDSEGNLKTVHDYERIPGHYHHYHVFGRDYLGTHKHFRIWYGDPIP